MSDPNSEERFIPLGDPPGYFDILQVEIWEEVAEKSPRKLHAAHGFTLEPLCLLLAKVRTDFESMRGADLTLMRQLLEDFGVSPKPGKRPVGRPKKEPEEDEDPLGLTEEEPPEPAFKKFTKPPIPKKGK